MTPSAQQEAPNPAYGSRECAPGIPAIADSKFKGKGGLGPGNLRKVEAFCRLGGLTPPRFNAAAPADHPDPGRDHPHPAQRRHPAHRLTRQLLPPLALLALAGCGGAPLATCLPPTGSPTAPSTPARPPQLGTSQALVGIDGSGSMLGFLNAGSGEWLSMLQAVKLALTAQALPQQLFRVGGSNAIPVTGVDAARDRCFFSGCESYGAVSSSLHTLWTLPAGPRDLPLRLMLSDLEVNDTDVNDLVAAVRGDGAKGASIGLLGVKLPFDGTIFDSQGQTIHVGRARRPLYLLATGEAARVRKLLEAVRENLSLKGVPTQDLQISILGESGRQPLQARSAQGDPPGSVNIGVPVAVGGTLFEPGNNADYQLLRLLPGNRGLLLSSATEVPKAGAAAPPGLVSITPVGAPGASSSGISLQSLQVSGTALTVGLRIDPGVSAAAVRLTVPAGSLPEEWWLRWNRTDRRSPEARDQTDGLVLAMTKLGQALSAPGSPPAAAFCVAFSRGDDSSPQGQGGAIVVVLAGILALAVLGGLVVHQIRQANDDGDGDGDSHGDDR